MFACLFCFLQLELMKRRIYTHAHTSRNACCSMNQNQRMSNQMRVHMNVIWTAVAAAEAAKFCLYWQEKNKFNWWCKQWVDVNIVKKFSDYFRLTSSMICKMVHYCLSFSIRPSIIISRIPTKNRIKSIWMNKYRVKCLNCSVK